MGKVFYGIFNPPLWFCLSLIPYYVNDFYSLLIKNHNTGFRLMIAGITRFLVLCLSFAACLIS